MRIIRHKLDNEKITASYQMASKDLAFFVDAGAKNPNNLGSLMRNAIEAACLASVVTQESADIREYVRTAAQASADLFEASRSVRVDESIVEPGKWITGFFLANICRSEEVLNSLCLTASDELRMSSTTHPEYRYLFVDALRSYWANADDTKRLLVNVMKATDPDRPDICKPD